MGLALDWISGGEHLHGKTSFYERLAVFDGVLLKGKSLSNYYFG